jgi:hypothetical protein
MVTHMSVIARVRKHVAVFVFSFEEGSHDNGRRAERPAGESGLALVVHGACVISADVLCSSLSGSRVTAILKSVNFRI